MKPLKRTRILISLGVIDVALLILLSYLHGRGNISTLSLVIGFFILAAFALAGIVAAYYKYPLKDDEVKDGFDPGSFVVSRSREGTAFEVLSGIAVIAAWIISLVTHQFVDADGGIAFRPIFGLFVMTVLPVSLLCNVYDPGSAFSRRRITNATQLKLAVRLRRCSATFIALLALLCTIDESCDDKWPAICIYFLMALASVICVVFAILFLTAKETK